MFSAKPPDGWVPQTTPDYGEVDDNPLAHHFPEVAERAPLVHSHPPPGALRSPFASSVSSTSTSSPPPLQQSPMRTRSGRQAGVGRRLNMSCPIKSPDDYTDIVAEPAAAATAAPPDSFKPAVVNATLFRQGQIGVQSMQQRDMYGKKKNKAKAYDPKLDEFRLYCDHYYKTLEDAKNQITRTKVDQYLTYCYYSEQKPKGQKGGVGIDWVKANKIVTVMQSCTIGPDGHPTPELAALLKSLDPANGCSYSFMNITKCALKVILRFCWCLQWG